MWCGVVWVPLRILFVVCSHSAAVNSLHSAKRALRDPVCVKGNPGFIPAFVLGQPNPPPLRVYTENETIAHHYTALHTHSCLQFALCVRARV